MGVTHGLTLVIPAIVGHFHCRFLVKMQMRTGHLIHFFSLILLLAACGGAADENMTMTPPATPGGRLCLNQCKIAKDYCVQKCDLNERSCTAKIQVQAMQDYDAYIRQQYTAKATVEFRPSDFERDESCTKPKASCVKDCEKNYRGCFTECGGKINVSTSCQFMCF
jgi:hypothetical protein